MSRGNLLTNDGIVWSFVDVYLSPVGIVLRHIGISENSFNGAFRYARIAIDARVGIDI